VPYKYSSNLFSVLEIYDGYGIMNDFQSARGMLDTGQFQRERWLINCFGFTGWMVQRLQFHTLIKLNIRSNPSEVPTDSISPPKRPSVVQQDGLKGLRNSRTFLAMSESVSVSPLHSTSSAATYFSSLPRWTAKTLDTVCVAVVSTRVRVLVPCSNWAVL
jgi:hypothetical protein